MIEMSLTWQQPRTPSYGNTLSWTVPSLTDNESTPHNFMRN